MRKKGLNKSISREKIFNVLIIYLLAVISVFAQSNNSSNKINDSDIAAETASIVLVNSNPKDVAIMVLFGKATYRKMIQNLIWQQNTIL